jgi:hypothetical protein
MTSQNSIDPWRDSWHNHRVLRRTSGQALLGMICFCALLVTVRGETQTNKAKEEVWWSLKPVVCPAVPDGSEPNPIDRFINAELKRRQLQPVGPADKLVLLRRVYLDLIGLPPSPSQQQEFLADDSPDAYEKVVARLLEDEQHAVRYARHWLDVLRYADTDERMRAAPGIYLWRDWVINALHDDLPYNEFVQVQLTARRSSERTQMSATGYRSVREPRPGDMFALGLLSRGAGDDPQDLAIAAVETVSTAFMGMTVGCAKCHDHMYDPIGQKDFYAMKALFDPLVLRKVTLASSAELVAAGKAAAEVERKRAPAQRALDEFVAPFKARLYEERVLMLPADIQTIIRKPERQRTVSEQKIADDYFPILRIDADKVSEIMTEEERKKNRELQEKVDAAGSTDGGGRRGGGGNIPVFFTVEADRVREREQFYYLTSGDPTRPEKQHPSKPGWPFAKELPDFRDGRIEAFADWLTAPENPLFARVAVNRMWQWHFGRGLLKLSSDFGELGGKPSNQPLLDWLASEFVRRKYSMKEMHKLMVTSAAYQRATEAGEELAAANSKIDPDNAYLWHFRLRRLEAEPIWDCIHAAAGTLDLTVGGRSFEVGGEGRGGRRRGRTSTTESAPNIGDKRRAAYLTRGYSSSRDVTSHFLQSFDVDDGREPCPIRTQTVTAPQALFLMNSSEVENAARALAERTLKEANNDLKSGVQAMYRLVIGRTPSAAELERALAYVENDPARLKQFAWLLFNLDEFIYVR